MAISLPNYVIVLQPLSVKRDWGVVRVGMESGLTKQRSTRRTPTLTINTVFFIKGDTNKSDFDKWFEFSIDRGVGVFNYFDKTTNSKYEVRIANNPITWAYSGKPSGFWTANVILESR